MAVEALTVGEAIDPQADILRVIFESLPIGVMVADGGGRLLFYNSAAERMLGICTTDAIPTGWTSISGWYLSDQVTLLPSEQLPLVRAIRGEEIADELIFVRGAQPGDGGWIRVSGWPLYDAQGSVSAGVVVLHDVSGGHRALQTIPLLAQVVEQTADSVMVTDTQGYIQYVNPAFEATTGYSRQEVLGKTPRILKSGRHDAEFYRQLWSRLAEGRSFKGMIINRKKTGELYWAQQAITPMQDESGRLTHFVSVLQDITQLRKEQEHEFQLQLAREVQQRFYRAAPMLPGFDIGAEAHPAYETGGDYFDFIAMADGSVVIAVGDVNGHGFSSALIMALTRAYLRSFAAMQLELDEILARVNQVLLQDLERGQYVTLALARLNPHQRTLSYASAGHVPGYILSETGEVKRILDSTGPPLGLFPESNFPLQRAIGLDPGETALLITDGITESTTPEGDQFGALRVLDYVRTHRHDSAQQIANGIYQAARAYVRNDPQEDDITSVVIKVERSK